MRQIIVIRTHYEAEQTRGVLLVLDDDRVIFQCYTLELAWRDNKPRKSCIPAGIYPVQFEYSDKFKQKLYELKEVPDRSEVKIHAGNFHYQIHGCLLIGSRYFDINHDGLKDIVNSRDTLKELHIALLGITETKITIYGKH